MKLPDAKVCLAGFPLCHGEQNRCPQEANEGQRFCVAHGGAGPSVDVLRRTYLRQLRTAVDGVLMCRECAEVSLTGLGRCGTCITNVGAAWTLGGLLERLGFDEDSAQYLSLVCRRREKAPN